MTMPSGPSTRLARIVAATTVCAAGVVALVPSAASATPTGSGAIIDDPACATTSIGVGDDHTSSAITLSSPVNFDGQQFTTVEISNNAWMQLDGDYSNRLELFYADLDTRGTGIPVTYGETTFGGRPALCANYFDIGFYPMGVSPTNDMQSLLVDRSDIAAGDFDVVFNYDRVDGDYSGGTEVGFVSSANGVVYALPGSQVDDAFLDTNLSTGLVHGSRGSDVLGRYVFRFRGGVLVAGTTPETVIDSHPAALSATAPAFTYSASGSDLASFECRTVPAGAAAGAWAACPDAGFSGQGLQDGAYAFQVRAVDAYGNADPTPATYDFTLDTTAPETTVTDGPAATIGTGSASFAFASNETPASFACRISGAQAGAWEACADGSKTYAGLTDGTWTFEVRASDAAGNTDGTPASRTVTVNLGQPTITASTSSPGPLSELGWYRDTVTITYTCAGNGSPLVGACPAAREVPRAQQGKVVFRASIVTADGDTASVSTTLFIDKGRPRAQVKGFSGQETYRSMPKPRCKASDPRSGLADCTVTVRKVVQKGGDVMVVVVARAVDNAGNVRVVRKQAPFRGR